MIIQRLRESVEILASSPGNQIDWLTRERLPVDELALQFEDCLEAALATELFECSLVEKLRRLDAELDAISGIDSGDSWTESAVRNDRRWDVIRRTAQLALSQERWPIDTGE